MRDQYRCYGSSFARFDVRAVEDKSRYDETCQHKVAESQNVSVNGFLRFEEPLMSERRSSQPSYPLNSSQQNEAKLNHAMAIAMEQQLLRCAE